MKGRNLVNGSAACNSFFHYNGTHCGVRSDHACTREREFLEIVADRHDDHVSKVIEEDARRFAKTRLTLATRAISKPTTKDIGPAVNNA